MFSIKSRKCQEPPRTDKSQTPTNADLQSTYYSTLSTKLDTPRRTLPTIRGRRCSRRMAHSDIKTRFKAFSFFVFQKNACDLGFAAYEIFGPKGPCTTTFRPSKYQKATFTKKMHATLDSQLITYFAQTAPAGIFNDPFY